MEEDEFDGGVVVGQKSTVMVPRHINKRSLRNKGLCITFDEKNLRDYVTGFHKRKNMRRKEAQKQLHEMGRRMRAEARKKRKESRELDQLKERDEEDAGSDGEEDEPITAPPVSETKKYENSNTTITVTTSELVNGDEDLEPVHTIPKPSSRLEKNHKLLAPSKSMKGPAKKLGKNHKLPARRKSMKGRPKKKTLLKKNRKSGSGRKRAQKE
ncbi:hypothetical protein KSP40_PGU016649 [Platanthera guangdongensis]|uniref:Nucleolar protein 12 n=1 Tax=Platanthera guangdongensis TaxID=2320717 RepID=A0ABR2MJP1_9ASPA